MTDEKDVQDVQTEDIILEDENSSFDLELKKLREKLKRCVKEKEEYLAGWQRAKADFINAGKNDEKRLEKFKKFAEIDVISDFLEIADSFEGAFCQKNWDGLDKQWQNGVKSLYNQFISILKKHNVEQIDVKGKRFNPEEHESIEQVNVKNKQEDEIITQEIRKGYKINGKVLRPAQVKIGKYYE